jgi:SAM-dependent methyltransferase
MPNALSENLQACRLCETSSMEDILDVTTQPPANSLRRSGEPAPPKIPLMLCRCTACGTVQLTETVDPEYLFSHYVWVTGTSAAAHGYAREFAQKILSRVPAGRRKVLEVASNDGTFLKPFLSQGHEVVGVDPAANIAKTANDAGILTYPRFFGADTAGDVVGKHGLFDVVFARNVLPHVKDPNSVVAGMVAALDPAGLLAIEFHRADIILEELHYDSIYHEHLFYHSLASMERLTGSHGLHVFDVTTSPISGGSYVAYFSRQPRDPSAALLQARKHEERLGIQSSDAWRRFARRCTEHRDSLRSVVLELAAEGKKIIGFGASARSSTLLNFTGLDGKVITCIADNNPLKESRLTPGTDIPIVKSRDAFGTKPDVVLLLAWNFEKEILEEIKTVHGWTGIVVAPLPGPPRRIQI